MSTGWILLALLLGAGVAFVGFFIVKGIRTTPPKVVPEMVQFFEATESDQRVARLGLPTRGSEDQRHLLKRPVVAAAEASSLSADRSPVEFRLQATAPKGQRFELEKVRELLTNYWYRSQRHPTIKVSDQQPKGWAYLSQSNAPATFEEVFFEWELVAMLAEDIPPLTVDLMESYVAEVKRRFGPDVEYRLSSSIDDAAERAVELRRLQEDCDREAIIVLQAPKGTPFEGRKIWNVMHSLGLGWGDFDLFNWANETDVGGSFLFSVSTSTAPGYFLPEEIAANALGVDDLVFSFTIPGTYDAPAVFEAMLAAAEYSKNRLGGSLADEKGKDLDSNEIRAEIARIEKRLAEAGLVGAGAWPVPFGSHNVRATLFKRYRAIARQWGAPNQ